MLRMCFTLEFEIVFVSEYYDNYFDVPWDYYFQESKFLTPLHICHPGKTNHSPSPPLLLGIMC